MTSCVIVDTGTESTCRGRKNLLGKFNVILTSYFAIGRLMKQNFFFVGENQHASILGSHPLVMKENECQIEVLSLPDETMFPLVLDTLNVQSHQLGQGSGKIYFNLFFEQFFSFEN